MRRVILESPFAAPTPEGIGANIAYARACVKDCLSRGESPIASHLLFAQPGILDDAIPEQRALGIKAGWAWYGVADACVVYTDRGLSSGMDKGITRAKSFNLPVEYRKIPT